MRRNAEPVLFFALAALIHVVALLVIFARPDSAGGGGGGGAGGELGVAGAPGEVAALIEAWETPPEPAATPARTLPPAADTAPRMPEAESAPEAPAPAVTLSAAPRPEDVPARPEPASVRPSPLAVPNAPRPLPLPDQTPDRMPEVLEAADGPPSQTAPSSRPEPPADTAALPGIPENVEPPVASATHAPSATRSPAKKPAVPKRMTRNRATEDVPAAAASESAARDAEPEPTAPADAGQLGSAGGTPSQGAGKAPASTEAGADGAGGGPGAAALEQTLGAAVRAAIERQKSYPRRARLRRLEGQLTLRVTIARDGRLLETEIARSSGHDAFDAAALDAARAVGRYPSAPAELAGQHFTFVIPIAFRLR